MTTHSHPKVSQKDVSSLNAAHHPWAIQKTPNTPNGLHRAGTNHWATRAHNTKTNETIYVCEGWSQASRGQALNAILEREAQDAHDAEAIADQDAYLQTEDAKMNTTTPDNAGERIAAGSLIAELAGDDYVTTNEAASVIEWCREWARDCEWGDLDADGIAELADADVLKFSHRRIDGGLAFVLSDVRRVASDGNLTPAKNEDAARSRFVGLGSDVVYTIAASDATEYGALARVELERRAKVSDECDRYLAQLNTRTDSGPSRTGLIVERQASGSEDGHLYYVVSIDGTRVSGNGHMSAESAEAERADLVKLARLTYNEREALLELRANCPAPGDWGASILIADGPGNPRYITAADRNIPIADICMDELVSELQSEFAGATGVIVTLAGEVLAIEPAQEATETTESAREESAQVSALRAGATLLRERAASEHARYERMKSRPAGTHTDGKISEARQAYDDATRSATELDRMADKLAAITAAPLAGGCQDDDEPNDDPCDCGTVFGPNGLYQLHALGVHPDCTGELVSACPACGSPIDYCQGHGPSGDPEGFRILEQHDAGEHDDCHPAGCDDATSEPLYWPVPNKPKLTMLYSIDTADEPGTFFVYAPDGMSGTEATRAVNEAHEGTLRATSAESIGETTPGNAGAYRWLVRTEPAPAR